MTSIATNRAAIRVQYHGIKNTHNEAEALHVLPAASASSTHQTMRLVCFYCRPHESQISGLERAVQNSFDGVSLVNTAEANLNEIRNMVLRMREIAVQMANGIYADNPDRGYARSKLTSFFSKLILPLQMPTLTVWHS